MYAVIRTGGKQYRVEAGQRLRVERLAGEEGETIEFSDVLMVGDSDGDGVTIGTPAVADARVVAEIISQGRDKKIKVFKYKNKIRYRRLIGHRQHHTMLTIQEIFGPDGKSSGRYEIHKRDEAVEEAVSEPDDAAAAAEVADVAGEAAEADDGADEGDVSVEASAEAADDGAEAVATGVESDEEAAEGAEEETEATSSPRRSRSTAAKKATAAKKTTRARKATAAKKTTRARKSSAAKKTTRTRKDSDGS